MQVRLVAWPSFDVLLLVAVLVPVEIHDVVVLCPPLFLRTRLEQ